MAPAGSHGLPYTMLGAQYMWAVERAGGVPLPLSPALGAESLRRLVGMIDGLVLSGGEDVHPARYGEEPHPALGSVSPERDAMETAALAGALERDLPVLAICRGLQLLNVAWGGTLFQDLPAQRPGPLEHRQRAEPERSWHTVTVAPGSRLHTVAGAAELPVNSFHHQGIRRLAAGLREVAWSEDGLIEGVEAEGEGWVVGVQWHPERGPAEGAEGAAANAALFRALIRAAS